MSGKEKKAALEEKLQLLRSITKSNAVNNHTILPLETHFWILSFKAEKKDIGVFQSLLVGKLNVRVGTFARLSFCTLQIQSHNILNFSKRVLINY